MNERPEVVASYSLPVSMITITEDGLKLRVQNYVSLSEERKRLKSNGLQAASASLGLTVTLLSSEVEAIGPVSGASLEGAFWAVALGLLVFAVHEFRQFVNKPEPPDLVEEIKRASTAIQLEADGFKAGFDPQRPFPESWINKPDIPEHLKQL